jgi:hypothetical protein
MKQMIIRTKASRDDSSLNYINGYLSEGWVVLMVTPIAPDYLEYVLQKEYYKRK